MSGVIGRQLSTRGGVSLDYPYNILHTLKSLGLNLESLPKQDRISMWHLLTAARLQYAKLWKQKVVPSLENWIQSVIQMIKMDKLTWKIREQDPKGFIENWGKVKDYMEVRWNVKGFLRVFDWI